MAASDSKKVMEEEKDVKGSSLTNAENINDGPPLSEIKHDGNASKLAKSVNELNDLSIAIQAFKNRYDELQKHLEFIEQAIDTRTKELETLGTSNVQEAIKKDDVVRLDSDPKPKGEEEKEEESESELFTLCKTMCNRSLRKYIVLHLGETDKLREQVPLALKSAPKPSKLVFECIGRFFLQGSKAYTKNSPMIPARQASVLVLEYYLMSGCIASEKEVDLSLEEEASNAAVMWRKRLIVEGGVAKACEIDARGLLLFIACFGIPNVFNVEDIYNLVRLSNPREILHALRQSPGLSRKVSEAAEVMMKKGMVVEAVDLAYTFGFEEKFSPQTTLTSFLQKSDEAWKKAKQELRDSPSLLKESNEKYLTALKSIISCLEYHKVDFVELLPGWQLKDKIRTLEKYISELNKKTEEKSVAKRNVDKSHPSNKAKIPEAKRTRFTPKDPSVASPSVTALREHRIASHIDGNSSYDGSLMAQYLDGRSYGYHPNNYPPTAASVKIGSVSGSLPASYLGGAVAGSAMSAGIGNPTGSIPGYHGDMIMDNAGTTLNSSGHLYRWHGIGEGALSYDRSVGQSFVGQSSSTRINHLFGRTSTEGFAGLPDHHLSVGVGSRSGGSDLYSFADSIFDT